MSQLIRPLRAFVIATGLTLAGCASTPNAVPGQPSTPLGEEPVTETQVLEALRCQLARGFSQVHTLRETTYAENPAAGRFQFRAGTGTFAGRLQTVDSGGIKTNLVIPFVPFPGWEGTDSAPTTGTPNISMTNVTTAVQEVKRTFNITPPAQGASEDLAFCSELESRGVEVGSFVSDSIVNSFTSIMDMSPRPDGSTGLTSSKADITVSFTVAQTRGGGFALSLFPAGHDLRSIGPEGSSSQQRTGVYTMTLSLPTLVGETADTRRLLYCVDGGTANLCVEEPYSPARYAELRGQVDEAAVATRSLTIIPDDSVFPFAVSPTPGERTTQERPRPSEFLPSQPDY